MDRPAVAVFFSLVTAVSLAQGVRQANRGDPAAALEPPPPTRIVQLMDFLVRGGGSWISDNPSSRRKEAVDEPRFMTCAFEYALDRHLVRNRFGGEYADGRRETYWETVYAWDPERRIVAVLHCSAAGAYLQGELERLPDGSLRTSLVGVGPGGAPLAFRDVSAPLDDDAFASYFSVRGPDGWSTPRETRWYRRPPHAEVPRSARSARPSD